MKGRERSSKGCVCGQRGNINNGSNADGIIIYFMCSAYHECFSANWPVQKDVCQATCQW